VAGRNRTCGAPRFRRPLYRAELRPRASGRGWGRTSSLLRVKQALCQLSYSPKEREAPGQGLEPRSPSSAPGVLPGRRSRNASPSVHLARRGRRSSAASGSSYDTVGPGPNDVVQATRLPFDPGSPANRRPTWRGLGARRSCAFAKFAGKSRGLFSSELHCADSAEEPFSLRRGLEFDRSFFKLSITLSL
jgi:hypothetical protein